MTEPRRWTLIGYHPGGRQDHASLKGPEIGPDERIEVMPVADHEPDWLKQVPRSELNLIHHALRMVAMHPMTTNKTEIVKLADACWDESVARTQAEGP